MKQIHFKFRGKDVYIRSIFVGRWGFWFNVKIAITKPIYTAPGNECIYFRFLFWYFDRKPYPERMRWR